MNLLKEASSVFSKNCKGEVITDEDLQKLLLALQSVELAVKKAKSSKKRGESTAPSLYKAEEYFGFNNLGEEE